MLSVYHVVTSADVDCSISLFLFSNNKDEVVLAKLTISDFFIHGIAGINICRNTEPSCCYLLSYLIKYLNYWLNPWQLNFEQNLLSVAIKNRPHRNNHALTGT